MVSRWKWHVEAVKTGVGRVGRRGAWAHRVGVKILQDECRGAGGSIWGAGPEGMALLQATVDEGEVLGGRLVRRHALAHARAEHGVRPLPHEELQHSSTRLQQTYARLIST